MEEFELYRQVLRQELELATGCTEPIAIAYAAALARETLGCEPERLNAACSGNIVKNVKSVAVPGTGGLRGIEAAAVIGAVGGDAAAGLNVLHGLEDTQLTRAKELLAAGICSVSLLETNEVLHIRVEAEGGGHRALVEIRGSHTNVCSRRLDGVELAGSGGAQEDEEPAPEPEMSFAGIFDFAEGTDLSEERGLLERQIRCNSAIADAGIAGDFGLGVGRKLLERSQDEFTRARAKAAAGSDARMGGCLMPVVINSGSGNQGLTVSLPVVELARAWDCGEERMLRALLISNLTALHIKKHIGKLSAYCGASSAAAAVSAATTWLAGGSREQCAAALINTLAAVSGMICDGAKASCASKIAAALDAGFLAHVLAMSGRRCQGGEGIAGTDAENSIDKVGELAARGMSGTDRVILELMLS